MDRLQKRRDSDAKRTTERNKAKFISMYTQAVYGDIYQEAQQLYETIKQKNPGTKDLTKTIDFIQNVTPERTVPRYYFTRGSKQQKLHKNNTRMVLNIPLMETTQVSKVMSTMTTTGDALEDRDMVASAPGDGQEEMSASQPAPEQEDTHLDIPDRVYEELLQELRQDPDLYSIFNNFNPQDHYTENQQSDDMSDAFVTDEISPIEIELSQLGYK